MIRIQRSLLSVALVAILVDVAHAAEPGLVMALSAGPAMMLKSKSKALGQLLQPMASVSLQTPWRERFLLGGEVIAVLNVNEHYRVAGAVAVGRYSYWQRGGFSAGLQLGLGVGHNADILNADLSGNAVGPFVTAACDARWSVGPGWLLGGTLDTLNAATLRLSALVGRRF